MSPPAELCLRSQIIFDGSIRHPQKIEIISDGEFLYLYDPDLKQVIVSKLDKQIGG